MNERNGDDAEEDDADYHNNAVDNDGRDGYIGYIVLLSCFCLLV